jgi:hypothetical protein
MVNERIKTIKGIIRQAINLAMQGKWREAVAANKSLIENHAAGDVATYNRLGRAYLEVGDFVQARLAYSRALDLDRDNPIAGKNLDNLRRRDGATVAVSGSPTRFEPGLFLAETGKAGVARLYQPGPEPVLAGLVAGDRLQLEVEGQKLVVRNLRGDYVGLVEPRLAARFIRLIAGGNRYAVNFISNEGSMKVMVRETHQDPSQVGIVSFPPRGFERIRSYESDDTYSEGEREEEMDNLADEPEAYANRREGGLLIA